MRLETTKEKNEERQKWKEAYPSSLWQLFGFHRSLAFFRDPSRFLFLRFSMCFLARVSLTFNHSSLLYLAVTILSLLFWGGLVLRYLKICRAIFSEFLHILEFV